MTDRLAGQPTGPRVAVVGTGLIGGSILRRLAEAGVDVVGWDPDPGTQVLAKGQNLPFAGALRAAVADRDLVFLCAPLSLLPTLLDEVMAGTPAECVVTDVGSVKGAVAERAVAGGFPQRFVPGHPMAGTERSGLPAADPNLFAGAAWVLCPHRATPLTRVRFLASLLVDSLGARVTMMPPSTHDAVTALSSHIPHMLAATLAGAAAGSDVRDAVLTLAAGSFRDGTRVAATAPERTIDMLTHNRDAVLAQLKHVRDVLDQLTGAVQADDRSRLTELLTVSRTLRLDLARSLYTSSFRFEHGDTGAEFDFLLGLGADGRYLTRCSVDDAGVSYRTLTPAT